MSTFDGRARLVVDLYQQYDADRFTTWQPYLAVALDAPELSVKDSAVLTVALDAVSHPALSSVVAHVEAALEAGSCVKELIEAVLHLGNLESGMHGLHDALEAVELAVRARRAGGRPVPIDGPPLSPKDMEPEAPWPVPPVFPYHSPYPRLHYQVIENYHPQMWTAFKAWRQAQFRLRALLTRRMQELLVTACDTGINWPEPLLDHHMHAAFEVGVTAQEVVETVLLAAVVMPGARLSSISGRLLDGGPQAMHHGLTALERVLAQRDSRELLARRNAAAEWTGAPYIGAPVTADRS